MVRIYTRCNSGHYFTGPTCPFDSWSEDESREIAAAVHSLQERGEPLGVEQLRKHGVSEEALRWCIAIEFGNSESEFDAMVVDVYMKGGKQFLGDSMEFR